MVLAVHCGSLSPSGSFGRPAGQKRLGTDATALRIRVRLRSFGELAEEELEK
jgi:hypothetical protein